MNLQEYRRDKVSVIYQSFRLLPLLTTVENVMYPLELRGMKRKEAEEKAETFLADVGIPEGAWHRFPVTLSGGEQLLTQSDKYAVTVGGTLSGGTKITAGTSSGGGFGRF